MTLFRKLLVAVDFSVPSVAAAEVAADLARASGAIVTLAHVYEPFAYALPEGYAFLSEPQLERLFAGLNTQLAAQARALEQLGAPHVEVRLLHGFAADELCELAKRESYDLLIAGTQGRRWLGRALLGSVAERLVRTASCPVLTVRGKAR